MNKVKVLCTECACSFECDVVECQEYGNYVDAPEACPNCGVSFSGIGDDNPMVIMEND